MDDGFIDIPCDIKSCKPEERHTYVNILGTDYEITQQSSRDNAKLKNANGICEHYSKKIVVECDYGNDTMNVERLDLLKQKVLRHEIIHAFMFESGLNVSSEWGSDETLVDFIAIQIPKMVKAMIEANCIEVSI